MRLIDADAYIKAVCDECSEGTDEGYIDCPCLLVRSLQEMPSIEIVRCGECKWYDNREGCFFSTSEIDPEGFCSFGERREQ